MEVILIAVAAFLGGVVAALLGWLKTDEPFVPRKFTASLVRALVSAIGFAAAFHYTNSITPIDFLLAFLGGAGVDAVGNRLSGAIIRR